MLGSQSVFFESEQIKTQLTLMTFGKSHWAVMDVFNKSRAQKIDHENDAELFICGVSGFAHYCLALMKLTYLVSGSEPPN